MSYVQHWSIRDPGRRPTFRREDTLGSARTESIDGVTEYATTEVEDSGDVLRGTFERDGTRHGTFRMTRAGTARGVKGRNKSDGQRFHDAYLDELRSALERRARFFGPATRRRAWSWCVPAAPRTCRRS